MALVSLTRMLNDAAKGGYAVCYCESWNLESFQAVIEAAEACRSPIIAGFNGGFLRHRSRKQPENLAYYAGLRLALKRTPVPAVFLLNESDSLDQIREGIELGFNAVMPESEGLGLEAYQDLVEQVVEAAHRRQVAVEAQIGTLPTGGAEAHGHAEITDPARARDFARATGIDALGVSVGNIHILTRGKASIDLDVLRRIRESVEIPLVIHGGTSLPPECVQSLIALGVAKINFGTVLKQVYLEAVRCQLAKYHAPDNPHPYLGIGGDQDVMMAGREALRQKVQELLRLSGSAGRMEP
ncbi:MAG TPA: class II fructose-bisphosphate aldolase [Bryobacteraceae bacterium]|nr:class II fructose-bisphosphate aldolase [Bryobacteraceae bacterium]